MDIELGEFIILYAMTSHEETEDDILLFLYLEHLRKVGREEAARRRAEELRMLKRRREENYRKLESLLSAMKRRKVESVDGGDIDMSEVFGTEGNESDFLNGGSSVSSSAVNLESRPNSQNLLLLNPNPVYYERQELLLNNPSTSTQSHLFDSHSDDLSPNSET